MLWLLATVMTLLGSHVTMAQHIVSDSIYIPPTMLPKATVYLPAPPDSVSPEFVDSDKTMARPSGRSYRLDGTPATAQTRGIVIQDNRKTLRK